MVWRPTYSLFLASVTACGFGSFLFGYHVHEKAVLIILVPLSYALLLDPSDFSLLTVRRKHYIHALRITLVSGCVGLLPLLFTPQGMFSDAMALTSRKYAQNYIYSTLLSSTVDAFGKMWPH